MDKVKKIPMRKCIATSRSLTAVNIAQKKKLLDRQLEIEVKEDIYNELRKIIGEAY